MTKRFLLIHGAMRGAWLWERIIPFLESGGAWARAIDLPGHGRRADERTGVTLSTYVQDVVGTIRSEDLRDLILVGHSMSGMVISRVAEELPDRIRHLVYLAAVVALDGEALIDLLAKDRQDVLRRLPPGTREIFGTLDTLRPLYFTDQEGEDRESCLRKLTPQPYAAFLEKVHFTRFPAIDIPRTYIMGMKDRSLPPDLTIAFARRLKVEPVRIDAGHDMMVSRPREVAEVLLGLP